jgi:leucyl aminopeptidase
MPATLTAGTRIIRTASVAFAAALLVTICGPCAPTASSAEGPSARERLDSVSAENMLATVQDLADFGSRAFCIDEAGAAAEYVYDRFAALGLDVGYQNFTFAGYSSANIVAVVNGTDAGAGILLFGAHYDSENNMATSLSLAQELPAPGADDDASGVAAVIELAQALLGVQARQTLKFVAFGAEEMGFDDSGGLKGSSHFVELESAAGADYECAVVLDMIGYSGGLGNQGVIVTMTLDMPFSDAVTAAAHEWNLDIALSVLREPRIAYSDHSPFWSAGYPAVLVMERLSAEGYPTNPHYHSPLDTVDVLSGPQMENITRSLLAGALATLDPPERVPAWVPLLTIAAAVAVTIIMLALYSRKTRRGDVR